jgi:uncharacterized OsmC-like protein
MSQSNLNIQVHERQGKALITTREAALFVGRGPDGQELPDTFKAGELILGALGACVLGTVRSYAKNHGITGLEDVRAEIHGEEAEAPSRLARIEVLVELTGTLSADEELRLQRAAASCKIHNTLAQGVAIQVSVRRPVAVDPSR